MEATPADEDSAQEGKGSRQHPVLQESRLLLRPGCLADGFAILRNRVELEELQKLASSRQTGTLASGLVEAAQSVGHHAMMAEDVRWEQLVQWLSESTSLIVLIDSIILYRFASSGHFVVVHQVDQERVYYRDPDLSSVEYALRERFERAWEAKRRKVVRIWKRTPPSTSAPS